MYSRQYVLPTEPCDHICYPISGLSGPCHIHEHPSHRLGDQTTGVFQKRKAIIAPIRGVVKGKSKNLPPGRNAVVPGREGGWAVARVRDAGIGMDEATRARVFEKFYQGDGAHAVSGNGLGLSLVKRIVDLCGGEVTVDSAPGQGAAFTVRLPIEGAARQAA